MVRLLPDRRFVDLLAEHGGRVEDLLGGPLPRDGAEPSVDGGLGHAERGGNRADRKALPRELLDLRQQGFFPRPMGDWTVSCLGEL